METNTLLNGLWAMEPTALRQMASMPAVSPDNDDDYSPDDSDCTIINGIAILQASGVLMKNDSWMMQIFGGTSTMKLASQITQLANDDKIKGIILYIDSPGGQVSGTEEAANAIASCKKPIIAVASDTCASGAYWLASQCDYIFANESATVGSIGVYMMIPDTSKAWEDAGVKWNIVKSGVHKGAGADGLPIGEDDLSGFQQIIDDTNALFVSAVTSGRRYAVDSKQWATGDCFISARAKEFGLIDGIGNISDAFTYIGNQIMNTSDITKQLSASVATAELKADASIAISGEMLKASEAIAEAIVETPKVEAPALGIKEQLDLAKAEGYADGVQDEKARFAAVLKACGNRHEMAATAFISGHDIGKARENYATQLETELAEAKAQATANVHTGASYVAAIAPKASEVDDLEGEWERDEKLRAKFGGLKANFIATREFEKKTKTKIVK